MIDYAVDLLFVIVVPPMTGVAAWQVIEKQIIEKITVQRAIKHETTRCFYSVKPFFCCSFLGWHSPQWSSAVIVVCPRELKRKRRSYLLSYIHNKESVSMKSAVQVGQRSTWYEEANGTWLSRGATAEDKSPIETCRSRVGKKLTLIFFFFLTSPGLRLSYIQIQQPDQGTCLLFSSIKSQFSPGSLLVLGTHLQCTHSSNWRLCTITGLTFSSKVGIGFITGTDTLRCDECPLWKEITGGVLLGEEVWKKGLCAQRLLKLSTGQRAYIYTL